MQSDLLSGDTATHHLRQLRERSPLVHCITNDVVQAFTANVLLALGASPAMVVDADEAAQFSALADSLLINTGTLTRPQMTAMKAAIASANRAGKPWTLDPVAVGALRLRTEFAREIISLNPAAIRGNASEIMALAGLRAAGRGVDSGDSPDAALEAAVALARSSGAVVAVTGEVDYITDGNKMRRVAGGTPLMTRVVGTGCALSAVVAAFTSLPGERLDGVASACWIMKHAGSLARERVQGPGSFAAVFVDMLYTQAFGEAE